MAGAVAGVRWVKLQCGDCGQRYELPEGGELIGRLRKYCAPCLEERKQRKAEKAAELRRS